jgi:hypothetical protein
MNGRQERTKQGVEQVIREVQLTIYEALKAKLGKEPTNAELKADVYRIIAEGNAESYLRMAQKRKR